MQVMPTAALHGLMWSVAAAGVEGGGVPPDLGTCLLQQKLAMVQLCIVRRRQAREQRAPVGALPSRPAPARMCATTCRAGQGHGVLMLPIFRTDIPPGYATGAT